MADFAHFPGANRKGALKETVFFVVVFCSLFVVKRRVLLGLGL